MIIVAHVLSARSAVMQGRMDPTVGGNASSSSSSSSRTAKTCLSALCYG